MDYFLSNRRGFTLLELIAVMLIMGVLGALAVPRYIELDATATIRSIDAAVSELNGRESLTWADIKISASGYSATGEAKVWGALSTDLGSDYTWTVGPNQSSGISRFEFKRASFDVSRRESTRSRPGIWVRK